MIKSFENPLTHRRWKTLDLPGKVMGIDIKEIAKNIICLMMKNIWKQHKIMKSYVVSNHLKFQ